MNPETRRSGPRRLVQRGVLWCALALCLGASGSATDYIVVAGGIPSWYPDNETVLIVDGQQAGLCVADKVYKLAVPAAVAIGNMLPNAPGCSAEAAVFGRPFRTAYATQAWLVGGGEARLFALDERRALRTLLWLPDRADPIASSWVSAEGYPLEAWAHLTMKIADKLLRGNRTGLRLPLPIPVQRYSPTSAGQFDNKCTNLQTLRTSGWYVPGMLNIYYVEKIGSWFGATYTPDYFWGYNCYDSGFPNVIFISYTREIPPIPTHELGHAFGLRGNDYPTGVGHIMPMAPGPFSTDNLMIRYLTPSNALTQRTFTLGQVFRMALDAQSWVYSSPGAGGAPKTCGPTPVAGACPALGLAWP